MINLVQISDPHFVGKFFNAKKALISGFSGHDIVLCQALAQCLDEDIRDVAEISDDDEFFLVMNGDLTADKSQA